MQSLAVNHYQMLGVGQQATIEEIKAAYARQLDVFRELLVQHDQSSGEKLDALREAFKVLTNQDARAAYDASLGAFKSSEVPPGIVPPQAAVQPADNSAEEREEKFEFVGDGGEYFRIWIINLFLSIISLGIYSAWAKVRREQYFHRNLMLDGSGFDYHGQPVAILKGRILAVVLFGGLSAAQHFSPLAYGFALLCLLPVVPWLAIKAFRFRAYNTSYRGLRFSFHGTYGQAFKVFVGYGLLAVVTLWLAFPVFYRQLRKFVLDNTRFGPTGFDCSVTTGSIYRIFLLPGFVLLAVMAGIVAITAMAASGGAGKGAIAALGIVFLLIPLLLILSQAIVLPYVAARTNNAIWNSTKLGTHCFISRLPVGGYIAMTVVNWLGIICTLGLFIPWARVRVARFRAEHLALEVEGSLEEFVAGEASAA